MDISISTLDSLSRLGDPMADEVVRRLTEDGKLSEVNRILEQWQVGTHEIPAGLPPYLRDFLEEARQGPDWAVQERLTRVREFFQDDGLHVGTVLALGSMAVAYAVPLGAKMMSLTHRLSYPERRMANTAQFTFELMQPDPFGPDSRFVASAVKVRLIHATIRHHLRDTGSWDEAAHGVPVSQQHLLIVWLALSVQVIDFLGRLRIRVTAQEAEDYLHTWRVAGVFLGIQPEVMPTTIGEARDLFATALASKGGPSPDGVELTKHLLDLYAGAVPGRMFDGIVPAMLRRLLGKKIADWLQVPHSPVWQAVIRCYVAALGVLERVEDRFRLGRGVLDRLFRLIYTVELRILTRGKTSPLELPLELSGYNADIAAKVTHPEQARHPGDEAIVPVLASDQVRT